MWGRVRVTWLGIVLAVATGLGASPAVGRDREGASVGDGDELRIVSANIRISGGDPPGLQWSDRLEALATLLAAARPDILGTQEGWDEQIRDLDAHFPDLERIDPSPPTSRPRIAPTIFYRRARFDRVEAGIRWLSDTPEVPGSRFALSRYPRSMSWAVLRDRQSGQTLFVANTHLTHLLPWVRRAQVRVLTEQIQQLNAAHHPMVLLGDFNERPTGGTREALVERLPQLRDPLGRRDTPQLATFNDFGGWMAGGRIDWVLLDGCLGPAAGRILRADRAPKGQPPAYASDHHPVLVSLQLESSGAQRCSSPGDVASRTGS